MKIVALKIKEKQDKQSISHYSNYQIVMLLLVLHDFSFVKLFRKY